MRYNKSEIMKKAWTLVRRFPSRYTMSSALKKAWAKAKRAMAEAIETAKAEQAAAERADRIASDPICSKLLAAGARVWEKSGKSRVYVDSSIIMEICDGLRVLYCNVVDGERISNTTRRQYFEAMDGGIYYDLNTRTWSWPHTYRYTENVVDRLSAAVA